MKLLFVNVGRRVELVQAFRKAGQALNCDLQIYGADIDIYAPALHFCDHTVITPRIKSTQYIPFLLDYCEKEGINAIIPTIDTDLLILAENKKKFAERNVKLVISDPETIAICRDKSKTAEYFKKLGLKCPETVNVSSKYIQGFPAFIKPKDGSSAINAFKVNSQNELDLYSQMIPEYIVQPFVRGVEYTVDVFCDFDGNPIYITPRIRLSVRAGEVLKTQICHDPEIVSEVKALLDSLKPCGPITVQVIKDSETNTNQYIEINARYGGGAPLSIMAGADSATALLRLLMGEKLEYCPNAAEDNAVFSRFDQTVRIK